MIIPKYVKVRRVLYSCVLFLGLVLISVDLAHALAQPADVSIVSGVSVFGLSGLIAIAGVIASWVRMETRLTDLREEHKLKTTDLEDRVRTFVPRAELDARFERLTEQIDELPERIVRLLDKRG